MSAYSELFYASLLAFVISQGEEDAVKVSSFVEDVIEWGGGCETCSYTETVVYITYEDSEGETDKYTYNGSFVELIQRLTETDDEEEY